MPRSRFVALSCLLLLASLLSATPAQAATITVTKTADTNDGACNADCSLREALIRANTVAGADTIRLPAGTYVLTRLGKDDAAASGDLDVTSEVTMRPISGTVQVDGNGIDRVIDVRSTGKLTVSRMRIVGGQPSGSVDGGGIRNAGTLDLIDSIVRGNAEVREWGGGLVNTGTAKVTRSLISGNHGKYAGGVANFGILTVVDSRLTGNVSGDSGGGIYNGSQITIIRSEVTGNWAEHGGGIYSTGQLTVERSRISRNMSSETGAGVRTGGPGVIRETVIEANRAGSDGGGLHVSGSDTFTVERSLLKANHAGSGGGIRNQGTLQLFDSTLARNRANDGGGLLGGGGTAYVIDVSIIDNLAGVDELDGNGGGINRQSGSVFLANTLVAGNVDLVSPHHPDCIGAVISGGYNLLQTNGCSGYPGYDTDGTGAFSY
ncbi:MAG TPA: CSLREA domain-containing protein, partial [Actinomycetota bacterium]|nr:CSLREA domain-containing protein [Actinomycetota bacterium]